MIFIACTDNPHTPVIETYDEKQMKKYAQAGHTYRDTIPSIAYYEHIIPGAITFTLEETHPEGVVLRDSIVEWTPDTSHSSRTHEIVVKISDGENDVLFSWSVRVNLAPAFLYNWHIDTGNGPITTFIQKTNRIDTFHVIAGRDTSFCFDAVDPDTMDEPKLHIIKAPSFCSFSNAEGLSSYRIINHFGDTVLSRPLTIACTPKRSDLGYNDVCTIISYDGKEGYDTAKFNVTVDGFMESLSGNHIKIKSLGNGNIYIAGSKIINQNDEDIYVKKMSGTGHVLWEKLFGTIANENLTDIAIDTDDGLVIWGSKVWKISPEGNLIWSRDIVARKIYPHTDGTYYLLCNDGNFYHLDSAGSILKTIELKEELYSFVMTSAGHFIFCGQNCDSLKQDEILALKINSDGDLIWRKTYGEKYKYYGSSICSNEDTYVMCCHSPDSSGTGWNIKLITISGDGDTLKNSTIYRNAVMQSFKKSSAGDFVLLAGEISSVDVTPVCMRINQNGSIAWMKKFNEYTHYVFPGDMEETAPGSYLVSFVNLLKFIHEE